MDTVDHLSALYISSENKMSDVQTRLNFKLLSFKSLLIVIGVKPSISLECFYTVLRSTRLKFHLSKYISIVGLDCPKRQWSVSKEKAQQLFEVYSLNQSLVNNNIN